MGTYSKDISMKDVKEYYDYFINGKTIECIINEIMRSSGCSFKFACVEFVKCTRKEVIDF